MLRCNGMEFSKEFKDYVGLVLKYLRREMYLGEYYLDIDYIESHPEDDDDSVTYAMVHIDDSYLTIRLSVYGVMQEWFEKGDLQRVSMTLLHEMCHSFTEPIWRWARYDCSPSQESTIRRDNERQVQRIANVIGWLLPDRWYDIAVLVGKES